MCKMCIKSNADHNCLYMNLLTIVNKTEQEICFLLFVIIQLYNNNNTIND